MSDEQQTIRVNFSKPVALFPLDSAVLLPQQVIPLHIFEPRYRQMVEHALDSSGQIAIGVFEGDRWKEEYHGRPPIKPAVCLGQIAQHERLPDGRFNLLVQGVCRARIVEELPPEEDVLYRRVLLDPVGQADEESLMDASLEGVRLWVTEALASGPLSRLTVADQVLQYAEDEDVPTTAVLELVSFALLTEPRIRYRLLAEGEVHERAHIVQTALLDLEHLIRLAIAQHPERWPKGLSWN